jgi:hypothetical protein
VVSIGASLAKRNLDVRAVTFVGDVVAALEIGLAHAR